jgi:O-antigen/teichoic acid export membrane protein
VPRTVTARDTLTSQTLLLAAGQAAVKGGQVVTTIVLVRLMTPAEWSHLALALSVYLAGLTFGSLNLHQGILFFAARTRPDEQRALIVRTAGVLAVSGGLTGLVVLALGSAIGGRVLSGAHLRWVVLALVLELPTLAAAQGLVAAGRIKGAAAWDVATGVLQFAALAVPAVLGSGARGVVIGLAAAAAVRLIAFVALVGGAFRGPWWVPGRALVWCQVRYSLPLGVVLGASVLNRSVDKWFVAAFAPSRLGAYTVAAQEIPLLSVLPYAVGTALAVPLVQSFATGDRDEARRLWRIQTASMSLVVVPVAVGLVLCAPELFRLLFTDAYASAVMPFRIFTLVLLHRVAEYGLILRAANRQRELVWASGILLASNLVIGAPLTSWFGMSGASAGTLIANAIAWVFVLRRIAGLLGVTWRQAFAWDVWVPVTMGCAAVALAVAGVAEVVDVGVGPRLLAKAALFAIGSVLVVRLSGLHRRVDAR